MNCKLTVGMATHTDFNGVYFTVQALRMNNPNLSQVELIVVDNAPSTEHGKACKHFIEGHCKSGMFDARYIPMSEVQGTSAPRQRVFDEARGEAVMCIDSHILLPPLTINRLLKWYDEHPESMDLLSGPIVMDGLDSMSTHFSERWRGAMEGTWGLAIRCKCGKTIIEALDIATPNSGVMALYRPLDESEPKVSIRCPHCNSIATTCNWAVQQQTLRAGGWMPLGADSDPDFEIPGMGLGLFTCRKSAWLGFNPNFREFGGEELYIHRKFRQAGHKALCLPWLKWVHRFGGAWMGQTYTRTTYSKVRNYVLGHLETGRSLEPVRKHFVDGVDNELKQDHISKEQWDLLVADPVANYQPPESCGTCADAAKASVAAANVPPPGDINERERARFVELMRQANKVTLVIKRMWWMSLLKEAGKENATIIQSGNMPATIEPTDLVILYSIHQAEPTYKELMAFKDATKRILIRSSQAFGENGEGGGPGILPAVRRFMHEYPAWHVVEHSTESWGYTLVSRHEDDRKERPGKIVMAINFAKAMAAHAVDGFGKTSLPILDARLSKCTLCTKRQDEHCTVCGCPIAEKASMKSSFCPIGEWVAEE